MEAVWAAREPRGSARLLLLAIADRTNGKGLAWPSLTYLARRTRLGRSTTLRHLAALERTGHVAITRVKGQANQYRIVERVPERDRSQTGTQPVPIWDGYPSRIETAPVPRVRPNPSRSQKRSHREPSLVALTPDGFDRFWASYPRRQKKQAAWKAWKALAPDATVQAAIVTALGWQRRQPDWQREGGRFIPHGATYLNGRQWEDEPTAVRWQDDHTAGNIQAIRDFVDEGKR